jgi:hypothetical protein
MLQAVSAASQECMLDTVGVTVLQSPLLLFRAQARGRGALRPGRAFFPRGPGINAPTFPKTWCIGLGLVECTVNFVNLARANMPPV